jgi:hypothetical protein
MTAMSDPTPEPDRPDALICPWCSTRVTPETATCPTCGAVLKGDEDTILPGVTAVDDKVLRGETKPQPRSRLLSWISGEYDEPAGTKADPGAIAPPDPEVQREIRRLELEAEVANLQAEVEARRIEAVVDHLDETGDATDAEEMVAAVVADDAAVDAEVASLTGDANGIPAPSTTAPSPAATEPEPSSAEQPPA